MCVAVQIALVDLAVEIEQSGGDLFGSAILVAAAGPNDEFVDVLDRIGGLGPALGQFLRRFGLDHGQYPQDFAILVAIPPLPPLEILWGLQSPDRFNARSICLPHGCPRTR